MLAAKIIICCKEVAQTYLRSLDIPGRAIGLTGLDGFAGLLDLLEDSFVGERVFGDDISGLSLEGNVVRLDACIGVS